MIRVEVYGKPDCGLCEEVKATLSKVRREIPFDLNEIDIESTAELYERYKARIPLVVINGRLAFKFHVEEAALRRRLARERPAEPPQRLVHGRRWRSMAEGIRSPNPVERRSFLNWFLGTSIGAFLAVALYPVTRYLIPPKVAESAAASVALDVKATTIKPNSGQIFKFGTRPAILVRTAGGELRAFTAVCTHLNCTVQYREDLQHIWCACHNGHFDPVTGRNIGGPPPRPLEPYAVNLRGETIVVSRNPQGSGQA